MVTIYKRLGMSEKSFMNFLRKEYKTKSITTIAKEIKCDKEGLRIYFKKFNIRTRSCVERSCLRHRKKVSLSKKQKEILEGLILSDFHISKHSKKSEQARVSFGFKYKEFAEEIIKELIDLDFPPIYQDKKTNCFHSKSKSFVEIGDFHKRWYKDGKKIIPKDLKLTPEVCYWWYLGDGSIVDYGIKLSTDGFDLKFVKFLVRSLNDIGFQSTYIESNRIRIKSESVDDFLNYIGKCRVSCYKYKWKTKTKRKNYKWE